MAFSNFLPCAPRNLDSSISMTTASFNALNVNFDQFPGILPVGSFETLAINMYDDSLVNPPGSHLRVLITP